jgi:hypothetical protein
MKSTWWLPPSENEYLVLRIPEEYQGRIEDYEALMTRFSEKISFMIELEREESPQNLWVGIREMERLDLFRGLTPEYLSGTQVMAAWGLPHYLMQKCRGEDEAELEYPLLANLEKEPEDWTMYFSDWIMEILPYYPLTS